MLDNNVIGCQRNGKLDGLDILVMPGGGSKKQYNSMQEEGAEAIRRFVRGAGAFFREQAGAFLGQRAPQRRRTVARSSKGCLTPLISW